MGVRNFLRRVMGAQISSAVGEQNLRDMQYSIEYLTLEVSRLRSLV